MTFKKQGEGFFIGTASSEVPDIERGDLEQALKKAPLFLAIIFSYFCVFLAEQWNHDVTASFKAGILRNCIYATFAVTGRNLLNLPQFYRAGSFSWRAPTGKCWWPTDQSERALYFFYVIKL